MTRMPRFECLQIVIQDVSEPDAFSRACISMLSSLLSFGRLSASRSTGRAGGWAWVWLVALTHV